MKRTQINTWIGVSIVAAIICTSYVWHLIYTMSSSCTNPQNIIKKEYNTYENGDVWPPDILNNQYAQPVRDTRYITQSGPTGISTNIGYVNTAYRQVGILAPTKPVNAMRSELLIIMGRPLYLNRNKWQYYAITDQRNEVKLTIRTRGKPATNEYGVDELYTNDTVLVQGYNTYFRVDLYEDNYIQYK